MLNLLFTTVALFNPGTLISQFPNENKCCDQVQVLRHEQGQSSMHAANTHIYIVITINTSLSCMDCLPLPVEVAVIVVISQACCVT